MRRCTRYIPGVLLLLSCLLFPAFGQLTGTGGIKGKVRNFNGDGIVGATITARQNQTNGASARSGKNGEFFLEGLKPGLYNVVVEAKGYAPGVKYDVEIKQGKIRDLGSNLILEVDRVSDVIIRGSVFYKDGTSVADCDVDVALLGANGDVKRLTTVSTGYSGEFTYRRPQGKATYRFTSKCHGVTASRDVSVEEAAIYNTSVLLPVNRTEKQP